MGKELTVFVEGVGRFVELFVVKSRERITYQ